jgi:hypothetical protein
MIIFLLGTCAGAMMLKETKAPSPRSEIVRPSRDFDHARHQQLTLRFNTFVNSRENRGRTDLDQEFSLAWLALNYRYHATDEHSEDFNRLWLAHGRGPAEQFVYLQEKAFQGFHFNALSTIETGCYALYMLASKFDSTLLGLSQTRRNRDVTIANCNQRLSQAKPNHALTNYFANLASDVQYVELLDIRNVSSHRSVILREITVGAANPDLTEILIGGNRLRLDENFTETRRSWVVSQVNEIMNLAQLLMNEAAMPSN